VRALSDVPDPFEGLEVALGERTLYPELDDVYLGHVDGLAVHGLATAANPAP